MLGSLGLDLLLLLIIIKIKIAYALPQCSTKIDFPGAGTVFRAFSPPTCKVDGCLLHRSLKFQMSDWHDIDTSREAALTSDLFNTLTILSVAFAGQSL